MIIVKVYHKLTHKGESGGVCVKGSPQTGLEPVTNRLTADRSTTELLRIRRINATKVSFICLLLHRHGINNDAFMLEIYHIARFLSMGSLVICLNKVTCISILNLLYYM